MRASGDYVLASAIHPGVIGRHVTYSPEVSGTLQCCREGLRSVFTIDGVRKLHGWTHASLDLVLDHLSTMPTNDYVTELSGFGFRTVREQAIHLFNCEGFWVRTLQGLRYADRTPEECPAVADARRLQQEVSQSTHAYLSTLTNQKLNADTE